MAIMGFKQFIRERNRHITSTLKEQAVCKSLEVLTNDSEMFVNITLSIQCPNAEAIHHPHRLAFDLICVRRDKE
jgi:hypothetical protein